MAAILKAIQSVEREREKLPQMLKEASKKYSGEVLLVRNYSGETFTLKEDYVTSVIEIKASFPFEPFKKDSTGADSVTYEQFAKNLTIDEMKEVAEKLAKLGF